MALIKCYECEKEISDKAPACPHCGAPKQEQETPEPIIEEKAPEQTQVVKTEQETTRSFFEALDRYLSRYSPSGWTKKVRSEAEELMSTMSPQYSFDEMLRRGYDLRGDGSGLSRAEVPMATQQIGAIGAHELRKMTSGLDDTSRVIFQTQYSSEKKDRGIAILLALFGFDRFYFGQIGLGILKYLSWITIVIGLLWWLIDIFTAGGRADEFNRNKAREIAVSLRT